LAQIPLRIDMVYWATPVPASMRVVRRPAVRPKIDLRCEPGASIASCRSPVRASLMLRTPRSERHCRRVERAVPNPGAAAGVGTSIAMEPKALLLLRPGPRGQRASKRCDGEACRRRRPVEEARTICGERNAGGTSTVPLDLAFAPGNGEAANPAMGQLVDPVASLGNRHQHGVATRRRHRRVVLVQGTPVLMTSASKRSAVAEFMRPKLQ
jgi:hypothetical protein